MHLNAYAQAQGEEASGWRSETQPAVRARSQAGGGAGAGGEAGIVRAHGILPGTGPFFLVCDKGVASAKGRGQACPAGEGEAQRVPWRLLLVLVLALGSGVSISDRFAGHCPGSHTGPAQPEEHVSSHCASTVCSQGVE